jgi:hypothetical protein
MKCHVEKFIKSKIEDYDNDCHNDINLDFATLIDYERKRLHNQQLCFCEDYGKNEYFKMYKNRIMLSDEEIIKADLKY